MKPYKETLIEILEAKKERLEDVIENANTEVAMATRNLEIFREEATQAIKDIGFITDLLSQLSPPEPFDYMDSDVA